MLDTEQYVARMNEAQQRASIAPTDETRLSWQNIQQGWEAILRIQQEILNGKSKAVSTSVPTIASPPVQPLKALPWTVVKGGKAALERGATQGRKADLKVHQG